MPIASATIIGAGLIGTSLGLRLSEAGVDVTLYDKDETVTRTAVARGAGRAGRADGSRADLVVVCVPPSVTAPVLREAQAMNMGRVYSDVASVKTATVAHAVALRCDMRSYVPGHPVAGAEHSGPFFARADLFTGRPWALCPSERTDESACAIMFEFVRAVRATPCLFSPAEHDSAMALISHAPHVISSAIAALFSEVDDRTVKASGSGLQDMTRIAKGNALLWSDIIVSNRGPLVGVLRQVADRLNGVAAELAAFDHNGGTGPGRHGDDVLSSLLLAGAEGRRRIEQAQRMPSPGRRAG